MRMIGIFHCSSLSNLYLLNPLKWSRNNIKRGEYFTTIITFEIEKARHIASVFVMGDICLA